MENVTPYLRKYMLPLGLGIFGVILSGYGLIQSFPHRADSDDIMFKSASESQESVKSAKIENEMTIDISGEVNNPGVYTLIEGSRVGDAIEKAGGLSDQADTEFVEKSFNLAAKLTDGAKLYIPAMNEGIGSTSDNSGITINTGTTSNTGVTASGLININSASESELDTLTGVGPVTIGKIIDNRPYNTLEELVSKKAVSKSVFEKIKDSISLY